MNSSNDKAEQTEEKQEVKEVKDTGERLPMHPDIDKIRVSEEDGNKMYTLLHKNDLSVVTPDQISALMETTFSNWEYNDLQLNLFARFMIVDLGFGGLIDYGQLKILNNFLAEVYRRYNRVPFHNFLHGFMVTQMTYALIYQNDLKDKLSKREMLCMLVAAIGHDLDHPGLGNYYHQKAKTVLVKENTVSPLEEHHYATLEAILSKDDCNVLKLKEINKEGEKPEEVGEEEQQKARKKIKALILATDLIKQKKYLDELAEIGDKFSLNTPEHLELLQCLIIKLSDLSNESRPLTTAHIWVEHLYEEFFPEGDLENSMGIAPMGMMDRKTSKLSGNQVFFLSNFVIPLVQAAGKVLPKVEEIYMEPINKQLEFYKSKVRKQWE